MTTERRKELKRLADASTPGPLQTGIVNPDLDPVEWFREVMGKRTDEGRDIWAVTTTYSPFEGESYLLVAITGNGPCSEANAEFHIAARDAVPELLDALEKAEHENDTLRDVAKDIHWMARRYADNRQSYATSLFNGHTRALLKLGVELNPTGDGTIWARDMMGRSCDGLTDEEAAMGGPPSGMYNGWRNEDVEHERAENARLRARVETLEAAATEYRDSVYRDIVLHFVTQKRRKAWEAADAHLRAALEADDRRGEPETILDR